MASKNERVRAWIFVETEDALKTSKAISEYFTAGGDDYVIVRADVVTPDQSDGDKLVVVPVDTAHDDALAEVLGLIMDAAGKESRTTVYRVMNREDHNPWPPHGAHCFVTEDELRALPAQEFSPAGRHPKSPGRNAFG